jgi:hypothetical protein
MALNIFLMLSSMSVIFLVYVLVQFVQEGRRTERTTSRGIRLPLVSARKKVVVVTMPLARGMNYREDQVIGFPSRGGDRHEHSAGAASPGRTRIMSR